MDSPEAWIRWLTQQSGPPQRPFVSLCYAQSLDGSLSRVRGRPLALSGPASQQFTHQLRAAHDGILIGVGTLLADNPQLTVRLAPGASPQPIVLDSRLRLPADCFLLREHPRRPWIACLQESSPERQAELMAAGARLLLLPAASDGRISLSALLAELKAAGIRRLMVEGGAAVLTSFLQARLADLVAITLAPVLVGGLHSVQAPLATSDENLPRLQTMACYPRGEDLLIIGRFSATASAP